jgi:putative isomerase
VGRFELAGALRRKTLELVKGLPDIYEYYNPLTGARPPKAAPLLGWTAAVYIDLAIKETHAAES